MLLLFLYLKINIFFFGSHVWFVKNLSFSLINLKFCSLQKVKSFWDLLIYVNCSAIEKHWIQLYNHTYLSCSEFIESIQFILQNNFFQFNEQFYKQKFGSAMGNLISPILADIVMQDLETYALSKLCYDSIFYFRYVDDILLCVPKI